MSDTTFDDRLIGQWKLNPTHSSASFSIDYTVAKFRGTFEEVDGALRDGVLTGAVKVASINVKEPTLGSHLQSPDFFDAERHPEISFRSDVLAIDGDSLTLEGQLTLRGVTKPVRATGTVSGPTEFMTHTRLGFALETVIDRTEFGMAWNADLPKGGKALSDEVTLSVELEFDLL